jgi:hypothetical protein
VREEGCFAGKAGDKENEVIYFYLWSARISE